MRDPHPFFALILAPTRELAAQVQAQFHALGKTIGLSTALLVGGVPITQQSDLMKVSPPHVVIGNFILFVGLLLHFVVFILFKLYTSPIYIHLAEALLSDYCGYFALFYFSFSYCLK